MRKKNDIVFLFFLLGYFIQVRAQNPHTYDYVFYLDFKTNNLFPNKVPDHKVNNIYVFKPFVEYRYYKSPLISKSINDSTFTCKQAKVNNSYVIYPIRQKETEYYFTKQIRKKLKRFINPLLTSFNGDSLFFIKKELDSIMILAEKTDLKEYKMGGKLVNFLSSYKATQLVFVDVLIYEINSFPTQYFKFTFIVFDISKQNIFYYDNRCQYTRSFSAANQDVKYDSLYLKNNFTVKHMAKKYKQFLKPYLKYTKNENI